MTLLLTQKRTKRIPFFYRIAKLNRLERKWLFGVVTWCPVGTTLRDVDLHFSDLRGLYTVDFGKFLQLDGFRAGKRSRSS